MAKITKREAALSAVAGRLSAAVVRELDQTPKLNYESPRVWKGWDGNQYLGVTVFTPDGEVDVRFYISPPR